MDLGESELRILDALAQTIDEPLPISALADRVQARSGSGPSFDAEESLSSLADEALVGFREVDGARIPSLRFSHTQFPDAMASVELWRKRRLLADRPACALTLQRLTSTLTGEGPIVSVCLGDPERNLSLRRLEPVVLTQAPTDQGGGRDPARVQRRITERTRHVEATVPLRIDPLIVPAQRFGELLTVPGANPASRLLRNQTCIWHPQAFWQIVARHLPHGRGLAPASPRQLDSLGEDLVAWNLARWGYEEMGRRLECDEGNLCPEVAAVGALASGRPRWVGAAGVVLAKAEVDPGLLVYLAKAEGEAGRLMGLLEAIHNRQPGGGLEQALEVLDVMDVELRGIDPGTVEEALDLYGG